MKVQYTDGPDALEIVEANKVAQRGEPVEVPEDVGERLLEQGWSEVKPPKPSPSRKKKE